MNSNSSDVLLCWGKTTKKGSYHPAVFHMLDVGMVAQQLLTQDAAPRFRVALSAAIDIKDPKSLMNWLPLVISLHDIGKLSSPFQSQVVDQKRRLEAEGFTFASTRFTNKVFRHQYISAAVAESVMVTEFPWLLPLKGVLRDTFAGHHGTFTSTATIGKSHKFIKGVEEDSWGDLQLTAMRLLSDALSGNDAPPLNPPPNLRVATVALTGFLILCDWIGSDECRFQATPNLPLAQYLPLGRSRARDAVKDLGFFRTQPAKAWSGFGDVFPRIEDPRPLQQAIDNLGAEYVSWPALYIIEAPTGEGKTEAALALASRLGSTGWSDELYFALPTMATSNQMFGRVLKFLNTSQKDAAAVKLIHGQAFLAEDSLIHQFVGSSQDRESPAYAAPAWFASRRRALLAPFGIGTIDQAELTVLNARFYPLRLIGLAGKVVIIDEVHAYDAYMNTIIDHVLWWLAALGTPVILLSATLPVARHHQLAAAYERGLNKQPFDTAEGKPSKTIPYPVLAAYTRHHTAIASPPAAHPDQQLTIRLVDGGSPEEEANRLLEHVAGGGAVCRIANTVDRAQRIYQALADHASPKVEQYLLHARMPGEERLSREAQLVELLGPDTSRTNSDKIIVIGTQVLEQSLDLDFDVMVSDLAPTDLLLQRAGRLHRHTSRERPVIHQNPVLEVVIETDGRDQSDSKFGPSARIYEPFILWKTWLTLRSKATQGEIKLSLPTDYRPLIESTYDDRRDILTDNDLDRVALDAAWEVHQHNQSKMTDSATQRLIPGPVPHKSIIEDAGLYFEEEEDTARQGWGTAATRYSQESITIVPLFQEGTDVVIISGETPLTFKTCDADNQLRLLRRSIRVSHKTLTRELPRLRVQELAWFKDVPLLRHVYPLVLENGTREIGGWTVRLDPELGLIIRKDRDE